MTNGNSDDVGFFGLIAFLIRSLVALIVAVITAPLTLINTGRNMVILGVVLAILFIPLDFFAIVVNLIVGAVEWVSRGIVWGTIGFLNIIIEIGGGFLNFTFTTTFNFILNGLNFLIEIINGIIAILAGAVNSIVAGLVGIINAALCFPLSPIPGCPTPIVLPPLVPVFAFTPVTTLTSVFDLSSAIIDPVPFVDAIVLPRLILGADSLFTLILAFLGL